MAKTTNNKKPQAKAYDAVQKLMRDIIKGVVIALLVKLLKLN